MSEETAESPRPYRLIGEMKLDKMEGLLNDAAAGGYSVHTFTVMSDGIKHIALLVHADALDIAHAAASAPAPLATDTEPPANEDGESSDSTETTNSPSAEGESLTPTEGESSESPETPATTTKPRGGKRKPETPAPDADKDNVTND